MIHISDLMLELLDELENPRQETHADWFAA